MKLGIAEILEAASRLEHNEKIGYLRKNDSAPLRQVLEYAFDKRIEWELPPGKPPYTPCAFLDQEGMLYSEMKKMYLFIKGGNPGLKQLKRESIFLQLLESIPQADADLLCAVKDHIMPFDGITEDVVREAFPDCLKFPKQNVVAPPQPNPVMETVTPEEILNKVEVTEVKERPKKKAKKEIKKSEELS